MKGIPTNVNESPLIVGVSGIRGIVGQSLTPQSVMDFAACYGTPRTGRTVVVSRDGRSSGEALQHAVIGGLLGVGCQVIDIGIASTPTCGYYVQSTQAAGGIQITASHNPPPWNGLKLFRPEGFVVSPREGEVVADDYRNRRFQLAPWNLVGRTVLDLDPHQMHLDRVLSLVDVASIRRCQFRVVLDANHGSGGMFGERLLTELGCEVTVLGGVADGMFEHEPEPIAANLQGLCQAVSNYRADIGFATDPDADRLAIVDDRGVYIGEELTLALAILHRTALQAGPVVINSSTSRVSEDLARNAGCPVMRTPVGEVHVAERMVAEQALIGGEGNGGVIDPRVGMGRDSAIGMALILELLAARQEKLHEVVAPLPVYAIRKDKFAIDRSKLPAILESAKAMFSDGVIDTADGLRVDWDFGWVQVRASNTEPIIRVIAEARNESDAIRLCEQVGNLVNA